MATAATKDRLLVLYEAQSTQIVKWCGVLYLSMEYLMGRLLINLFNSGYRYGAFSFDGFGSGF